MFESIDFSLPPAGRASAYRLDIVERAFETQYSYTEKSALSELIDRDILQIERFTLDPDTEISAVWIDAHEKYGPTAPGYSGEESRKHTRWKLLAAEWLLENNHELQRWWNPHDGRRYLHADIEYNLWFGFVDVFCDKCELAIEVGTVQKNRMTRPFGFWTAEGMLSIDKNEIMYSPDVGLNEGLITVPYQSNPDGPPFTAFRVKQIAEPDGYDDVIINR